MSEFLFTLKEDYDYCIKWKGQSALCYSAKKLATMYPDPTKPPRIVGEVLLAEPKAKKTADGEESKGIRPLGAIRLCAKDLPVFPYLYRKGFLYKKAGYVCVGEDTYLCLVQSRALFLALLLSALVVGGVALGLILGLGGKQIGPDHPMPDHDPNRVPVEGDQGDQVEKEEGGGHVSMIYTKTAKVDLSAKEIGVYFANPQKSNHGVVLELYVTAGGMDYLIGKSGLIEPDYGIRKMTLDTSEVSLSVTSEDVVYTGKYVVRYYDPETGERAVVSSEIAGVTITVAE